MDIQRRQLLWVRHSVVVAILPQAQPLEDLVLRVYHAVVILIQGGECQVSLRARTGWLCREVPEQLGTVIDDAVAVAIESQPGVIGTGSGPGDLFGVAARVEIEMNPVRQICKVETIAIKIENDWRTRTAWIVRSL